MDLEAFKRKYIAEGFRKGYAKAKMLTEKKVILTKPSADQVPVDPSGSEIHVGSIVSCDLHHVQGEVIDIRISDRFARTGNYFIFIQPDNGGKVVKTTQDDVKVLG